MADYAPAEVHADQDRITLLEAEPYGADLEPTAMVTEDGYSEAELRAVERGIVEPGAYVDAVVDGRRRERTVHRCGIDRRYRRGLRAVGARLARHRRCGDADVRTRMWADRQ